MAREFRLHDIGEGLVEARIVRWLVPVGGLVAVDQPLVEVETDKAVVEIPSPFAGTVLRHGADDGDMLAVGEVLAVVGDEEDRGQGSGEAAPIVGTLSEDAQVLTAAHDASTRPSHRVRVLPSVRKLARELGVDLDAVTGSGDHGLISRADVLSAASAGTPAAGGASSPLVRRLAGDLGVDLSAVTGTGAGGRITRDDVVSAGGRRRPLSPMRKTIATNVSRSWSEIPQVTAFEEVDASRLLSVRRALAARHDQPIPVDALVVAAVVPALRAFPEFNASLDGDELVFHPRQDVGIAVDAVDGLLVAVVRDAGSKDLLSLAAEVARLGDRARARQLTRGELVGQTFTVSNIGAVGGGYGTPLVPVGTVGILSVGQAKDQPVARNGTVAIAPMMPLSLSYDHRVIDGAVGRRFLSMVVENLAEPSLFLLV